MAIPDYQSLMLPVLKSAAAGEVRIGDIVERLAIELEISDGELAELIPSGKQTTFSNRVHWAKSYLKQAGLVRATKMARLASFLFIFGAFDSDLITFCALAGLSVSLNGGVARRSSRVQTAARPVADPVLTPAPAQSFAMRRQQPWRK